MPDLPAPDDVKGELRLINFKVDLLTKKLEEITQGFATKAELKAVQEDILAIKGWAGWAIKIVLGAVLVAVVSLVIAKGGIPRP